VDEAELLDQQPSTRRLPHQAGVHARPLGHPPLPADLRIRRVIGGGHETVRQNRVRRRGLETALGRPGEAGLGEIGLSVHGPAS